MNHPAPIGVGIGGSPSSETLVRLQQGIWVVRAWTKRGGGGHLGPAPQLEQLLSHLGLRYHPVVSRGPWNTGHC